MSKVAIVFDRAFGKRLSELSRFGYVWIVESSTNTPVIRDFWQDTPATDRFRTKNEVTSFQDNADLSAEEICVGVVAVVDEHHGELSSDPAWSEIEVFGVSLTPNLRRALADVGASSFESTKDGFVCHRSRDA